MSAQFLTFYKTAAASAGYLLSHEETRAAPTAFEAKSHLPPTALAAICPHDSGTANRGTFELTLAGTTPGAGYDQARVMGAVLLGNTTALRVTLAYDPAIGDSFTIIDNDLGDAIADRFAGLGEGARFSLSSKKGGPLYPFEITYVGGTGNDVVVRTVPEPAVATSLLLASGMFAGARFRKSAGGRRYISGYASSSTVTITS